MAIFSTTGASIHSIAAAVPRQVESNHDFALITPAERAFLIKTTGVENRRVAPNSVATSDLCYAAAEKVLTEQNINRTDIGLLIFVSQSNDYILPATSATLQQRLGLSKNTMAFDVGLGCSGYVYGLSIAVSLMRTFNTPKALLLAGDISTTSCSPEDKSTYPLFGDAGTATLLNLSRNTETWHGNMLTDGTGADAIMVRDGMQRHKITADSFKAYSAGEGMSHTPVQLTLKGEEVFAFAIREVPSSVKDLMAMAGENIDNVDYFIMHQANKLMNETIRKKLRIPSEKVPYSIDEFGNTSSASIPLTLVTRLAEQLETPKTLLLSGFGVGLSWGNLLINSTRINCLPLIEV